MLSWDEEVTPASPLNYARNPSEHGSVAQASLPPASSPPAAAGKRVKASDKRIINGQD